MTLDTKRWFAKSCFFIVTLNVVMLSVLLLSALMLNVSAPSQSTTTNLSLLSWLQPEGEGIGLPEEVVQPSLPPLVCLSVGQHVIPEARNCLQIFLVALKVK